MSVTVSMTFASLAEAMAALSSLPSGATPTKPEKVKPDPKPTTAATPAAAPAPSSPTAEAPPAVAPAPKVQPSAPALDYPTLQKAVFELAATPAGREAAIALCKELGVATFKDLPADRWPAALDLVKARTEELKAMPVA